MRDEFYISLLGKSMTFHSLQSVGDLMARATNDIREVNFLFSPGINMVFGSIIFCLSRSSSAGRSILPCYLPQSSLLWLLYIHRSVHEKTQTRHEQC